MIASIVLAAASASAASSAASQPMVVPIYRCSTPGTRHPNLPDGSGAASLRSKAGSIGAGRQGSPPTARPQSVSLARLHALGR